MVTVAARSPYARDAARLLGERIRMARRARRWSQQDLADRVGISVPTLRKVENGDLGVAIGTAFEVAALTGVVLFHTDRDRLSVELDRARAQSALLPQRTPPRGAPVHDDF